MRCDQCKHWADESREWDFDKSGMRECLAIQQAWDVKDAAFTPEKPRYDYDDWDEVERLEAEALKAAKAVAQDGSSYAASIRTTGDFGCVLFEAKP